MCAPVQTSFNLSFSKPLAAGSSFAISTPGLTSGDCYAPVSGSDIASLYLPNQESNLTAVYYEGEPANNYAGSYMVFTLLEGISASRTYLIVVDRSNLLRRSCSANSSWSVTVYPYQQASGRAGFLGRIEEYPKKCFQYYSALNFSNPMQQFPTGINLTLYLAFQFSSDTTVTITLPGFSNKMGAYRMNPTAESSSDLVGQGVDAALCNLTWSSNFSWTGSWHEGLVENNFRDSKIVLYAM